MPLEVKIPKEITEYREKIIFGLSIRQLICSIVATLFGIIIFLLTHKLIGKDLALYLILFEAAPIMGVGFLRINGFPFERYIMLIIRHIFGQQIRIYKTNLSVDFFDYYSDFSLGITASEELIDRVKKEKYSRIKNEKLNPKNISTKQQKYNQTSKTKSNNKQ